MTLKAMPLVDVSGGESLEEMVNQTVTLYNIAQMYLDKQHETDPLSEKWEEFWKSYLDTLERAIDYQLKLADEMAAQYTDFVDAGRFYSAWACLAGHPGSRYAHLGVLA